MTAHRLSADPYNLVITGVGGQGNVLASRVLGNMLSGMGYIVTIGETFGASQRGGSVMSHLRVSRKDTFSPQIPRGGAHVVVSMEPSETLRVLAGYGNPDVMTLCNTRPVHSIAVISGEHAYPEEAQLKEWIREISGRAWFLDATEAAMAMGNAVLANIMMIGALGETGTLPIDIDHFEAVISEMMPPEKTAANRQAYHRGAQMLRSSHDQETG